MQYFPLFLDLTDKPVLVVGGGEVASRKVEALLRANARVTVISPVITDYLSKCATTGTLIWVQSQYRESFLKNCIQVWATTDDPELNHKVYIDAKNQNILVNVVDDKPYCDFITPSMINRGKIQIAISSGGSAPVLVRRIRERIERVLPQNIGLLAEFASTKREHIKTQYKTVDERRYFWERFFSHQDVEMANNNIALESCYKKMLVMPELVTSSRIWMEFGTDVELISIKTLRIMQQAELVLYPETCPFEFVDLCRRDAKRADYKNWDDLVEILKKSHTADVRKICIFINKNTMDNDRRLRAMIGQDSVMRVIN